MRLENNYIGYSLTKNKNNKNFMVKETPLNQNKSDELSFTSSCKKINDNSSFIKRIFFSFTSFIATALSLVGILPLLKKINKKFFSNVTEKFIYKTTGNAKEVSTNTINKAVKETKVPVKKLLLNAEEITKNTTKHEVKTLAQRWNDLRWGDKQQNFIIINNKLDGLEGDYDIMVKKLTALCFNYKNENPDVDKKVSDAVDLPPFFLTIRT